MVAPLNLGGGSSKEEWRILAERASKETDHAKLIEIVRKLCDVLDKNDLKDLKDSA